VSERQYRILIVDDEESIRRSLRAYPEDEGFEVIATGTAEEGLELLGSAPADAVIVDMRLQGMDGNTFIEKAHVLDPEMSVFIYTGSVGYQPPSHLQSLGVGEGQVFRKPLSDMSVLVRAMRRLLDVRREG
jgi:two-component system, OmpR family, response regulator